MRSCTLLWLPASLSTVSFFRAHWVKTSWTMKNAGWSSEIVTYGPASSLLAICSLRPVSSSFSLAVNQLWISRPCYITWSLSRTTMRPSGSRISQWLRELPSSCSRSLRPSSACAGCSSIMDTRANRLLKPLTQFCSSSRSSLGVWASNPSSSISSRCHGSCACGGTQRASCSHTKCS